MKMIKLRRRIAINEILLSIAMFCVCSFALLDEVSIPFPAFSVVKLPILYVGGLCLLFQARSLLRYVLKKNYFYVLVTILVFALLLVWTMYANRNTRIGSAPLRGTLRLMLFLVELFFLMILLSEAGRSHAILKFLFRYVLIMVLATDFLVFTGLRTFASGHMDAYLTGSKFTVVYLHMDLMVLWSILRKKEYMHVHVPRWMIALAGLVVILISIRVDCVTGIVGCFALAGLLAMIDSPSKKKLFRFTSPAMLLVFLVGSVLFPFILKAITSIPGVQYVLEVVFGREETLTGRLDIYLEFAKEMSGHWMSGYGFENGNIASATLFGYANAQNALLHWVLQVGLPAVFVLCYLFMQILFQVEKTRSGNMAKIMPLLALIYVYIVLGTVEITFTMRYLLWFAMMFLLANENKKNLPVEEKIPGPVA